MPGERLMKKLILFFVLLFITTSTINAQFLRGWGIKVGATFAKQDWEYSSLSSDLMNPDKRTGLNAGIFAEFLKAPVFSIVGELNYVQKGFKDTFIQTTATNPDGVGVESDYNLRVDYINISALAKLRYDLGIIRPYIVVGPKVDFEISKVLSLDIIDEVSNSFKKERLGLKVGFGTEINLITTTLLAEFIYDADFNALYDQQNLKVNTNSFDLRLGIMF
jgi:opacity protein-like surface antigen